MAKGASRLGTENCQSEIIRIFADGSIQPEIDLLAVEEPLEIRLGYWEESQLKHRAVSITMRTPGDDFELAAGFLFTEGILQSDAQISSIKHCGRFPNNQNTIRLDLSRETEINFKKLERNFFTTSSCGVCGKTSLEALATGAQPVRLKNSPSIDPQTVHFLPAELRRRQKVFEQTGGLHAAALFDTSGRLIDLREDVGRHNAVDKLIGAKFLAGEIPLFDKILFLSGRASFELIQKAVMAKIPIVCAVGAPSSLAVEAAKEFNITLFGFVRDGKFNVYSGKERLRGEIPR